ncbi:MAG: type II toxin-antitoxin system RelE/ParE family toxin [Mesorhizobium sp.]
MRVVEFLAIDGHSPFAAWFGTLESQAAAKVTVALARIEQGNLASLKSVGAGVLEHRIDWGPGYRVYLGRDGDELVILLTGGTKRRQQADIAAAQARWQEYRQRMKERT